MQATSIAAVLTPPRGTARATADAASMPGTVDTGSGSPSFAELLSGMAATPPETTAAVTEMAPAVTEDGVAEPKETAPVQIQAQRAIEEATKPNAKDKRVHLPSAEQPLIDAQAKDQPENTAPSAVESVVEAARQDPQKSAEPASSSPGEMAAWLASLLQIPPQTPTVADPEAGVANDHSGNIGELQATGSGRQTWAGTMPPNPIGRQVSGLSREHGRTADTAEIARTANGPAHTSTEQASEFVKLASTSQAKPAEATFRRADALAATNQQGLETDSSAPTHKQGQQMAPELAGPVPVLAVQQHSRPDISAGSLTVIATAGPPSIGKTTPALNTIATPRSEDTSIDPPFHSPGFAPAFSARVATLVRDGLEHARVHLNPVEMGPVSLRLSLDGQQVRVDMTAEVAATRQVLEQALPSLAGALREAGFMLSGGGVHQPAAEAKGNFGQDPNASSGSQANSTPGQGAGSASGSFAGGAGPQGGQPQTAGQSWSQDDRRTSEQLITVGSDAADNATPLAAGAARRTGTRLVDTFA